MLGSFAADTTGVAVASLALAGEKSASTFVSVTTGPELSSFKLDLSTDQLLLTFSETVKQTLVRLWATPSCRSEARRFLSGGAVVAIGAAVATPASDVSEDFVPPSLVEFSLDMDQLVARISFSEPVNVDSFDVTTLTFTSTGASSASGVSLTGGAISSANSSVVNVTLTVDDANRIKVDAGLCSRLNTTFLLMKNTMVVDVSGNALDAAALPAAAPGYQVDVTAPSVSAVGLDMNTGVLSINFTETVDVSEFVEALLRFGGSSVSGSVATLDSSSVFPTSDTEVVTITLSNGTLNELKLNMAISTSSGNAIRLSTPWG